jgi:hypothetical protein
MNLPRTRLAILLLGALAPVIPLFAAEAARPQPDAVVPQSYQWLVTPCANWNCASAALLEAAGDKFVVSVPTTSTDFPWLVVRRVPTGSFYIPPDAPFSVEEFDGMTEASSRYIAIDAERIPILMTPVDGRKLVIALRTAPSRRRAGGK